ncbi:MAG: response regulator [Leptospiraceae bacterium]|nr:response regulator [Leptospiraceae bacterium]
MDNKILIVEDNFIASDEVNDRLTALGYTALDSAFNGEEAIAKARSFRPDLILMDINLGEGIDGIEAAQHIQAERDTPIIYLTAYDDEATLERARITDPYAYIIKPFDERELRIAIDIALCRHRADRQITIANEQADRTFQVHQDLCAVVSHFVEHPLRHCQEVSRDILKNLANMDPAQMEQQLHQIAKTSSVLFKSLLQVMEWSCQADQAADMPARQFKPREILEETLALLEESLKSQNYNLELHTEIGSDLALVCGIDSVLWKTVIAVTIVYLINAVKSAGSTIKINASILDSRTFQICLLQPEAGDLARNLPNLNQAAKSKDADQLDADYDLKSLLWARQTVIQNGGSMQMESLSGDDCRVCYQSPVLLTSS